MENMLRPTDFIARKTAFTAMLRAARLYDVMHVIVLRFKHLLGVENYFISSLREYIFI